MNWSYEKLAYIGVFLGFVIIMTIIFLVHDFNKDENNVKREMINKGIEKVSVY